MKTAEEQVREYRPWNEQEARDKELILHCLKDGPKVYRRDSVAYHMTASAWVVNPGRDRVLMAYHNLYDSWSWLGGHADGEEDLLAVAIREVQEESGIQKVKPIREELYSLEVLAVDGHVKKGQYVSSHLHLNLTYLLEGDDREELISKPDENSGVRWFSPREALRASTEPWLVEHIYRKLVQKWDSYPGNHYH